MKKTILFFAISFFVGSLAAQVRPDQQNTKTPADTDAIYTQEDGSLKKVLFSVFKEYVIDGTLDSLILSEDSILIAFNGAGTEIFRDTIAVGSINTDDQTIDTLQLNGTTLEISLEGDGQALQTVNLSSLQDGTGTDDQTAAEVPNTPAGNISATDVQAAINELDSEKASLTKLASNANGEGASLIGLEDATNIVTATTVEGGVIENRTAIDVLEAKDTITTLADTAFQTPIEGQLSWALDVNQFWVYNGGWWEQLATGIIDMIPDVTALRALAGVEGQRIYLKSYWDGLDYGGGYFTYFANDVTGRGDDGGISFASGAGFWVRDDRFFTATNFGAVQESDLGVIGKVSSDVELQNMFTQLPSGGSVVFDEGFVFLHQNELTPTINNANFAKELHIRGYGATLKRGNEVTSTLTVATTAAANSPTITVADASNFRVGMTITIVDFTAGGLGAGAVFESGQNRVISAISGNDITTSSNWNINDYPVGATVVTSMKQIFLGNNDNSSIKGLTFDGNMANNTTFFRWENVNELWFAGKNTIIEDITIYDAPAEGIIAGANARIDNIQIDSVGGNGIHLGLTKGLTISNSSFYKCNLRGAVATNDVGVGHNDGAISLSDGCFDIHIDNIYAEQCLSLIGGFQHEGVDRDVFLNNVKAVNCTQAIDFSYPVGVSQTGASNLHISDFLFDNCNFFGISNTNNTPLIQDFQLKNGILNATYLTLNGLADSKIEGVDIRIEGNTVNNALTVSNSTDIQIVNVSTRGGGISAFYSNVDTLLIEGGSYNDANALGISTSESTNSEVEITNVSVESNTASSFDGVRLANNGVLRNSTIIMQSASSGNGVLMGNDGVVQGNYINVNASANSVRIFGGSTGNVVTHNLLSKAITNGATDTHRQENSIIGVATSGNFGAVTATSIKVGSGNSQFYNDAALVNGTWFGVGGAFMSPKGTVTLGLGSGTGGGGFENVSGYTANEQSYTIRGGGSGVGFGDFAYYPNGGGNGNQGHFRFQISGNNIGSTPNAKIGVGELYSADRIGIGTTSPNASAILDISSTTKGSIPFPLMTQTERDSIPVTQGLFVFNTTTGAINYYNGTEWREIPSIIAP
jgi:hypothetical protein